MKIYSHIYDNIIKKIANNQILVIITGNIYQKYPVSLIDNDMEYISKQMIFNNIKNLNYFLYQQLLDKNDNIFKKVYEYSYYDWGEIDNLTFPQYLDTILKDGFLETHDYYMQFNDIYLSYWTHNQSFKINLIKSKILYEKLYNEIYCKPKKIKYSVLFVLDCFHKNKIGSNGAFMKRETKYKIFDNYDNIKSYIKYKLQKFIDTKKHNIISKILEIYLNKFLNRFNPYMEFNKYKSVKYFLENGNIDWLEFYQNILKNIMDKDDQTFHLSIEKFII